jgi:hypothetical protein
MPINPSMWSFLDHENKRKQNYERKEVNKDWEIMIGNCDTIALALQYLLLSYS